MFILWGIKIGYQYNVKKPHMIFFHPSTLLGDGSLWQTLFEDGHGRSLGELHCQMDPVLSGAVIGDSFLFVTMTCLLFIVL